MAAGPPRRGLRRRGARTEEQLADNLKAAELELTQDERSRLDEVSAPRLIYPHRHQLKTASGRRRCPYSARA